jgi:hypothetical protein
MRRFGWIGVVLVLLLSLVAGGIGYTLGAANATANAVAASGAHVTYVVQSGWGWGFGFPFVGLLFGILLLALIVGIIRRAAWGGRSGWALMHAASGPGPWAPRGPWAAGAWGPRPDGCGPIPGAGREGSGASGVHAGGQPAGGQPGDPPGGSMPQDGPGSAS